MGLGYVGLPVALALADAYETCVGLDISTARVEELRSGLDRTREADPTQLAESTLQLTDDPECLREATFIVVTVPTPIDIDRRPDLRPLRSASKTVGDRLSAGTVVVYESTVYPGVTEEVCGPILEEASGLVAGEDFFLGYSPERINPGDREHTLQRTIKVVAGDSPETLDRVARVYDRIIDAGTFRAASIRVAEAAKVIENTQRDLNIALMNELALIFDRIGLRTKDVLEAAGTKWNFLRFHPGLVGGHCIGVDPYYLTSMAEAVGYHPQVILAGRRINDGMGPFVAQRMVKMLIKRGHPVRGARVGIFGLTFKEDVPDLRNSRVPDIVQELKEFGCEVLVTDPLADTEEARHEYGIELVPQERLVELHGVVLAVAHAEYKEASVGGLCERLVPGGALADVKAVLRPSDVPPDFEYWSL